MRQDERIGIFTALRSMNDEMVACGGLNETRCGGIVLESRISRKCRQPFRPAVFAHLFTCSKFSWSAAARFKFWEAKLKLCLKYCNVHHPGLHSCGPGDAFGEGNCFSGDGVQKHGIDE
jgi:hypothetical protein